MPATHPGARARSPQIEAIALTALLAVAGTIAGCSSATNTTSPPATTYSIDSPFSGSDAFGDASGTFSDRRLRSAYRYPLAVGNRWDYLLRSRIVIIPDAGDPEVVEESARWSVQVLAAAQVGPRSYYQVAEGDPRNSFPPPPQSFVRQDADGLYERVEPAPARAAPAEPLAVTRAALASFERSTRAIPHRAAFSRAAALAAARLERMRHDFLGDAAATAEAEPNELTVLRYPLQVGAEWIVRASPEFGRVVQGQDEMVLPVGRVRAWRLLGVSELYSPSDRVHFWYGAAGLVRVHLHAELNATDDSGAIIGRAVAEYDQALARFTGASSTSPSGSATAGGDLGSH